MVEELLAKFPPYTNEKTYTPLRFPWRSKINCSGMLNEDSCLNKSCVMDAGCSSAFTKGSILFIRQIYQTDKDISCA